MRINFLKTALIRPNRGFEIQSHKQGLNIRFFMI